MANAYRPYEIVLQRGLASHQRSIAGHLSLTGHAAYRDASKFAVPACKLCAGLDMGNVLECKAAQPTHPLSDCKEVSLH